MFNSKIIEVGIGLLLVYLLASLVCSALKEWIDRLFDMRARDLEKGIIQLLGVELTAKFYQHPFIESITRRTLLDKILSLLPGVNRTGKPSRIKHSIFSAVLWDILFQEGKEGSTKKENEILMTGQTAEGKKQLLSYLEKGINSSVKSQSPGNTEKPSALISIANTAAAEITKAEELVTNIRQKFEEWFNNSMEQISIWSKQKSRIIIFWLALPICLVLNLDSIMIGKYLYNNDTARATVVAAAEQKLANSASITKIEKNIGTTTGDQAQSALAEAQSIVAEMQQVGIPLGWVLRKTQDQDMRGLPVNEGWLYKILGILLSIFAISMGAPFWFDLLRKIVPLRKSLQNNSKSTPGKET